MTERVLAPFGMSDTSFALTPDTRSRLARIHQREDDGSLTPLHDFELPAEPEVHMGGHGLCSTAVDYAKFLRMWLNDGAGPGGQVLQASTVSMAERNGLGELEVKGLPGVDPALSNDAEFFPGLSKSWALTSMVDDDAPTGRPAGSLAWAGLANLFYWIDRHNGSPASGARRSSRSPTPSRSRATTTSRRRSTGRSAPGARARRPRSEPGARAPPPPPPGGRGPPTAGRSRPHPL